jgi:hypothetical protein
MTLPTNAAFEAINRGIGETIRRVEIFESDGITPWQDGFGDRLMGGGVNLTYGDNERRAMDLTLNNSDNMLRSQPNGFWYDKIFKIYRGVKFDGSVVNARAAIIERTGGTTEGVRFAAYLKRFGLDAVYFDAAPSVAELLEYDVILSYTGSTATAQAATLLSLYNAGRYVVTISVANTSAHVPHIATSATLSDDWGISQPATPTDLSTGWTSEGVSGTVSGQAISALQGGAVAVARWLMNNASYAITGSVAFNQNGGRWFDLHLPSLVGTQNGTQINQLFANGIGWLRQLDSLTQWETQIGEFVIDSINGDYFPSSVKVTGRDYTKKCIQSKIESAMTFSAGTSVETLVRALAANAGITKFRLDVMPQTLTSALSFDRGTPRWDIMRQAAYANGYELFFDSDGYLKSRLFQDPVLSAETFIFDTGVGGNLSNLTRSTNDSRIYNHICVYGDPSSGEQRLPYFGEALNVEPNSPTRISKIGDRYYSFASTFFTSQQQCQDYANRLLSIHALESFELSFGAINYPWLEVGEIARVADPEAVPTDPDRYLIDTATIPLTLGPMSVTAKRVTIVGS